LLFFGVVVAGFLTDGFGAYNHLPVRKMNNCSVQIDSSFYMTNDSLKEKNGEAHGDYTDAEIRDMIKIARKYGKRDKTFDRFKSIVFDDNSGSYSYYNYVEGGENKYAFLSINVYKDYKDYTRNILSQSICIERDDVDALFNELADKGYDSRITVNDYSSNGYDDYMDEVEY